MGTIFERKAIYMCWGQDLKELNACLSEFWEVETVTAQNHSFANCGDTRGFLIILKRDKELVSHKEQ